MSLTGNRSELQKINLEMVFTTSMRKDRRDPKTKAWDTSTGKLREGVLRQGGKPPGKHGVQGVKQKNKNPFQGEGYD